MGATLPRPKGPAHATAHSIRTRIGGCCCCTYPLFCAMCDHVTTPLPVLGSGLIPPPRGRLVLCVLTSCHHVNRPGFGPAQSPIHFLEGWRLVCPAPCQMDSWESSASSPRISGYSPTLLQIWRSATTRSIMTCKWAVPTYGQGRLHLKMSQAGPGQALRNGCALSGDGMQVGLSLQVEIHRLLTSSNANLVEKELISAICCSISGCTSRP